MQKWWNVSERERCGFKLISSWLTDVSRSERTPSCVNACQDTVAWTVKHLSKVQRKASLKIEIVHFVRYFLAANNCLNNPSICRNGGGWVHWGGREINRSRITFSEPSCGLVGGSYRCFCQSGFTGQFCETSLSPASGRWRILLAKQSLLCSIISLIVCQPSPCRNGGSCYMVNGNDYVCLCPSSYTGRQCESLQCKSFLRQQSLSTTFAFSTAACSSSPCLNGGTCVTSSGAAVWACVCPSGYAGERCQELSSSNFVLWMILTMIRLII